MHPGTLQEETGLAPDALENLELRYVSLRNTKGELRQNYYYFAALKEGFEVYNSTEGRLVRTTARCLPN